MENICYQCAVVYTQYTQLVEHLYWRHGTQGEKCRNCFIKKWDFAPHLCGVLPHLDMTFGDENEDAATYYPYCICNEELGDHVPMIGCDHPKCTRNWFHFLCVGVVTPPDGSWYCPDCRAVIKEEARRTYRRKSQKIKSDIKSRK